MEFAQDDVMTWPYQERQLILVESDDAVEVVRRAASEDAGSTFAVDLLDAAARGTSTGRATGVGGAVAGAVGGAVAGAATTAAVHLWRERKRARSVNLPILVVSTSQAEGLSFPNGHPLANVVYVGDPGVAGNYYPTANFHRVLFEGKVAEALRLLRSLGATEISIEYLEGFDRGAGVDLSISAPAGEIGGGVNRTNKTSSGAKTTMQLSPTMQAQIPKDLIWFQSEPLWKEVANARLESGLRAFTIDVRYTEDFGINAKLRAKIEGVGLELGGTFTECKETVWKLSGTFAEQLSPGATSTQS